MHDAPVISLSIIKLPFCIIKNISHIFQYFDVIRTNLLIFLKQKLNYVAIRKYLLTIFSFNYHNI